MPIVRKPLMSRLAKAAEKGINIYQGRKRANNIRNLLEGSDDPMVSMLGGFVDPMTGEIGGTGEKLLGLYAAEKRAQAADEQAWNRVYYQDKMEQDREERRINREVQQQKVKDTRDLLEAAFDDIEVTQDASGKQKKKLKPGWVREKYSIDPKTLSRADLMKLIEAEIEQGGVSQRAITPGTIQKEPQFKPFSNINPLKWYEPEQQYQETQIDWNKYYGL